MFLRKLEVSKTLWDDGSLPEEWWTLGEYDFQNMVRNLDKSGHGVVSWRDLATYIILLKSNLPNERDLESFRRSFTSQPGGSDLLDQKHFAEVHTHFTNFFSRSQSGSTSQRSTRTVTTRSPSPVSPTSKTCFSVCTASTSSPPSKETRNASTWPPSCTLSYLPPQSLNTIQHIARGPIPQSYRLITTSSLCKIICLWSYHPAKRTKIDYTLLMFILDLY